MTSTADISPCGTYRYVLTREWDPSLDKVVFVMLNPSTADANIDDPTIRKCIGFARRWGYGGIVVVNLFALRSTDPKGLLKHADPIGPRNAEYIWSISNRGSNSLVVLAWGGVDKCFTERANVVARELSNYFQAKCLGYTKDRQPRHPLMLAYSTPLELFNP